MTPQQSPPAPTEPSIRSPGEAPDCAKVALQHASLRQAIMFTLALLFLVALAFLLHRFEFVPGGDLRGRVLIWIMFALWVPIFIESLIGYWAAGDTSWPASGRLLLLWMLPPYRMVLATHPRGGCVWLPILGWQRADLFLFDRLERALSIPMLLIATLILPILAIESFAANQVARYPELKLVLDIGTAVIWLAFAFELVIMSSVAEKRLPYLVKNWINLIIVLLPLLAFLRTFQLARMLRVGKAFSALKVFRLRGLGMRAWRGIVALEIIDRIIHRKPESRLAHLKRHLSDRERDLEVLRRRIGLLEQRVAREQAEAEQDAGSRAPEEKP